MQINQAPGVHHTSFIFPEMCWACLVPLCCSLTLVWAPCMDPRDSQFCTGGNASQEKQEAPFGKEPAQGSPGSDATQGIVLSPAATEGHLFLGCGLAILKGNSRSWSANLWFQMKHFSKEYGPFCLSLLHWCFFFSAQLRRENC